MSWLSHITCSFRARVCVHNFIAMWNAWTVCIWQLSFINFRYRWTIVSISTWRLQCHYLCYNARRLLVVQTVFIGVSNAANNRRRSPVMTTAEWWLGLSDHEIPLCERHSTLLHFRYMTWRVCVCVCVCLLRVIFLIFRLDALALSVIATATWLAGWLGGWLSHSGIVSKRLNLSENFFHHLKAPSL